MIIKVDENTPAFLKIEYIKKLTKNEALSILGKDLMLINIIKFFNIGNGGETNKQVLKIMKDFFDIDCRKRKYKTREVVHDNNEIFCKDSTVSRGCLTNRVKKENLIEYKCSICGNSGVWNNKELTLRLDHINGINNDNRLENLRYVCPNCDSQLDTYCNKNKAYKKIKYEREVND